MKLKQSMLLLFIIILISLRCDTTEPPTNGSLMLTVEDVSCTEAWLTLKVTDIPLPTSFILRQNDQARTTINLAVTDTLLYLDSLLPKQNYSFQLTSIQHQVSSNKANATTLDTTSHNFTWQTYTFGQHSSSVLYDVAIINENNIWAVGEIYMNDSLGQPDPKKYNLAVWNGSNWKVERVPYNYQGSTFYHPIQAIFAFNANDIWLCGNGVIRWNGQQFVEVPIPTSVWGPFQMNKIWGSSSSDLYAVGNGGSIVHYQNGVWKKIESGTTVDIQDIWGYANPFTSEKLILCAVSYVAQLGEQKVLRIANSKTDTINWGTGRRVHSIWFDNDKKLYACGGGVFFSSAPNNDWVEQTDVPLFFTERIRGKGKNDLFTVGHYGLLAHFNGTSWKTYPEASTAVVYNSLVYKNNLIAITGYTETKAVVQFMQYN